MNNEINLTGENCETGQIRYDNYQVHPLNWSTDTSNTKDQEIKILSEINQKLLKHVEFLEKNVSF